MLYKGALTAPLYVVIGFTTLAQTLGPDNQSCLQCVLSAFQWHLHSGLTAIRYADRSIERRL